jgi:putative NADH-flavin reductase
MQLLVIGASGRTGRHFIERAVSHGHRVAALIRKTSALTPCDGLEIIYGDPRDRNVLASVICGKDAVVSCLGQTSRADDHLLRDSSSALIDASKDHVGLRYIVVSQGLQFPTRNPILVILQWVLARYVADTAAMEGLIQRSPLDWTIVRPPRLLEGGLARGYRTNIGAMPPGRRSMQRADLAAFLLELVESRAHSRQIVAVTSR